MGTNYYIARRDTLKVDDRIEEVKVHIGKYSGGWVFHFQGAVCKTVAEWKKRLEDLPGEFVVVDEYGAEHDRHEFWRDTVEASRKPWGNSTKPPYNSRTYALEKGYNDTSAQWTAWDFLKGDMWIDDGHSFSNREFS